MLEAALTLAVLLAVLGVGLVWLGRRMATEGDPVVDRIEAVLPQIQCGQCDYPGCRPYAEAINRGEADINRCPPGGEQTVIALAELLGRDRIPLAETEVDTTPRVALIDEDRCIGCKLCIQACPVDAIVGAPKHMHTVIAAHCTGCDLCLPPCPVDCIEMVPVPMNIGRWQVPHPGRLSA